ncbi:MAG: HNH endonuclease [Chloroflexi bacterium]|nr:HNH endonuclease [Chloroflexota bacterium]
MQLSLEPLCRECAELGLVVSATDVDHIVPKRDGGQDELENLQSLCQAHHSAKTAGERGAGRGAGGRRPSVIAVCGPPGAGKSSYVRERHKWGDLVLDLDTLIEALGWLPSYEKPWGLMPFAWDARDAVLKRLERPSRILRAWVIATAPRSEQRGRLRSRFRASVVVLETPHAECLRRIGEDERRADKLDQWTPIVRRWWNAYEPSEADKVIK